MIFQDFRWKYLFAVDECRCSLYRSSLVHSSSHIDHLLPPYLVYDCLISLSFFFLLKMLKKQQNQCHMIHKHSIFFMKQRLTKDFKPTQKMRFDYPERPCLHSVFVGSG